MPLDVFVSLIHGNGCSISSFCILDLLDIDSWSKWSNTWKSEIVTDV